MAGCAVAGAAPPAQGDPGVMAPVNLDSLEPDPVVQWGVTGIGTSSSAAKPHVWDFAETGNRIYVAGTFTGVQQRGGVSPTPIQPQPYIAAFDRDTGDWISTFRPAVDKVVYEVEVAPNGKLIIGGEFTTVNGTPRVGLAMIDAVTGALDTTFTASVAGSNPKVREILRVGNYIYVAGQFSKIVRNGSNYWVWNAARLSASTGWVDPSWVPRFSGGLWDLAIDSGRQRIHAVGSFTSVNAQPGTNRMATVSSANGGSISGLAPYTFNDPNQLYTIAVGYADNRVYVGGSQHMLQVLDASTNQRIGYNTTGLGCDQFDFNTCNSFVAGGDYQVIEVAAGGTLLAGCHCFESETASLVGRTHFSSFTGIRTANKVAIGYRSSDSKVASTFVPSVTPNYYGTYALFADSRGCYYVGGYYTRSNNGYWLGGFGRFCAPVSPPTNLTASSVIGGQVHLSWTAPQSQFPISYYKIYRNGVWVRDTTSTSAAFTGLTPGATDTFTVHSRDASRRKSAAASVTVQVAALDTVDPTEPSPFTATKVATGVQLTWGQSTDNVGVKDYLVTLGGVTIATIPSPGGTYLHQSLTPGPRSYAVRARDHSGNLSSSATISIQI